MYPELLKIGDFTITSFGVMMALAFVAGFAVIRVQLRERGEDPEFAGDVLLGAVVGGIVGAKLYYVLLNWERTMVDPAGMIFSRGGLVWYGGLIGGALGVIYMIHRRGKNPVEMADVVAPGLALSYSIGRIGCFLVGDDYGRPTDSWVGMKFPNGYPPSTAGNLRRQFGVTVPDSIPDSTVLAVYPTQLFEVGLSFLIFLLLWTLRKRPRQAGWLVSLWLVLAGAERFFIEFFRAKDDRFFGMLTMAQLISMGLMALGLYLMARTAAGSRDTTRA